VRWGGFRASCLVGRGRLRGGGIVMLEFFFFFGSFEEFFASVVRDVMDGIDGDTLSIHAVHFTRGWKES
jgi:hypothetical protein